MELPEDYSPENNPSYRIQYLPLDTYSKKKTATGATNNNLKTEEDEVND